MSEEHSDKKPTLNKEQVDFAHDQMKEIHPLSKTPINVVYPLLNYICCCCSCLPGFAKKEVAEEPENQRALLGDALSAKFGKKKQKGRAQRKKGNLTTPEVAKDPILSLGFGIAAYRDMLWNLIFVYGLFTLLVMPAMHLYSKGTAYDQVLAAFKGDEDYSLGNLGYSSTECASIPISVGFITLQCSYGKIGQIYDYGVRSFPQVEPLDLCLNNDITNACKPNNAKFAERVTSSAFDNPSNVVIEFDSADFYTADAETADWCGAETAKIFVNYSCIQDVADQHEKYNALVVAIALGLLICGLWTINVRWLYQGGKIQRLEWDMATITAGDYTVEFPINYTNYLKWRNEFYLLPGGPESQGISPGLALKTYLTENIETYLKQDFMASMSASQLGKKKRRKAMDRVISGIQVADIVFSFNNAKLINQLRSRGATIASQNFEKLEEENEKVNEILKDFDSLTVPTVAFITFEEEDGYLLALGQQGDRQLLWQPFKFVEAPEPTDIIWENRHWTRTDYIRRQLTAFSIIALLLAITFYFIFRVAQYSAEVASVFPATDCDSLIGNYGDQIEPFAVLDFETIQANAEAGNKGIKSSGCLQCFCQDQLKNAEDKDAVLNAEYGADNTKICDEYVMLMYEVSFWKSSLSYLLTGVNFVLRKVVIALVTWIGYKTNTKELERITTIVFLCQFFNTAFLLLMVNADLSEQNFDWGLTSGSISDFNSVWFKSVGNTLISAMIFNGVFPVIDFFMFFGLRLLFRLLDSSCTLKMYKTKKTSIQGYLNCYLGPEYLLHYKYSAILNYTFVTFLYGFGLPMLFPVAFFSFFVLYFVEKTMLYYSYRLPPMYDATLSESVLNKLQFAPIFFLAFGYWMASSKQLLSNEYLTATASASATPITQHGYWSIFTASGWAAPAFPLLIGFIIFFVIFFFGGYLDALIAKCFPNFVIGDIELDEEIDNYWAALDQNDRSWSLEEERNARSNLGNMKILTDESLEKLTVSQITPGKTLQGVHSYDILANPLYLDDFQYVPANTPDRAEFIIDDDDDEENDCAQSDVVRLALNLAFLTEEDAKNFSFDKKTLKNALFAKFKGAAINAMT